MYFAEILSAMALAILGTNAAVAGQPKSGLDERACFCNYGDGTYFDCVSKAEADCTYSCSPEQATSEAAYAICLNDCTNSAQGINCCGCGDA
ncbi:hypothetical protein J7T55_001989 [Diaporthe amygdali]|uniref:uncharacterized protein n=1 Tax=Phomopsis amygdali TaxID=1214568 RepID=UPI0022FDBA74|nr:uncharacterized protein J7T55_001989 [Diaporthe amygdali]KAJ0117789.1 hypothetical protein J7T55_001989 [Diaporthe amygdali]